MDLFLTREDLEEFIKKLGYRIDETGIIMDPKTGKPVRSLCGEAINIKKDKDLAIVSGHIFTKNVAEFSYLLAKSFKNK